MRFGMALNLGPWPTIIQFHQQIASRTDGRIASPPAMNKFRPCNHRFKAMAKSDSQKASHVREQPIIVRKNSVFLRQPMGFTNGNMR